MIWHVDSNMASIGKTSSFQAHGVISLNKYVAQRCGFELGCGVGSS
jgi:hypothetical protein